VVLFLFKEDVVLRWTDRIGLEVLAAAKSVVSGVGMGQVRPRHRHQLFLTHNIVLISGQGLIRMSGRPVVAAVTLRVSGRKNLP